MKKGGKSTDYYLPTEMLVMINVVLDYKNQVRACACLCVCARVVKMDSVAFE